MNIELSDPKKAVEEIEARLAVLKSDESFYKDKLKKNEKNQRLLEHMKNTYTILAFCPAACKVADLLEEWGSPAKFSKQMLEELDQALHLDVFCIDAPEGKFGSTCYKSAFEFGVFEDGLRLMIYPSTLILNNDSCTSFQTGNQPVTIRSFLELYREPIADTTLHYLQGVIHAT